KTVSTPSIIEYTKIRWYADRCKRCHICVEACPKQALMLKNDIIIQNDNCDRIGVCQKMCPDLAIEVITPRSSEGAKP
ncbi:MAG: 4Fe-4S binding protein, partial [Chloroflexi bacterium]|nr:4Fe-4S binding protein [Chloroflexota bacterium]